MLQRAKHCLKPILKEENIVPDLHSTIEQVHHVVLKIRQLLLAQRAPYEVKKVLPNTVHMVIPFYIDGRSFQVAIR